MHNVLLGMASDSVSFGHELLLDLAFVTLTSSFFLLTWGFVRLCERV
jgi:hypothetical protein